MFVFENYKLVIHHAKAWQQEVGLFSIPSNDLLNLTVKTKLRCCHTQGNRLLMFHRC